MSSFKDPRHIAHDPAAPPRKDRRRRFMHLFEHGEPTRHSAKGHASEFSIADIHSRFVSCAPGDGCVALKFQNGMVVSISVPDGSSIRTNSSRSDSTPVNGAKGLADAIHLSCQDKTVAYLSSDKGVGGGTVLNMITQEDFIFILRSDKIIAFKVEPEG